MIYPSDLSIIDLFQEQVRLYPDHTALIFGNDRISYRELCERSNQLGHYLIKNGVSRDTLVPLCIDRSIAMIVGILGILKAGGAYVPVDPDYPSDRISYILKDTGSSLIVADKHGRSRINSDYDCRCIELDEMWDQIALESKASVDHSIDPHDLAYIIYTSGSTGQPKGVMIEHVNVVRLFKTDPCLYDFTADDVWVMFHSFCFDFSVWEVFGALLFGGKLLLITKADMQDTVSFSTLLQKKEVTILNQTPSAFYVLQEYLIHHLEGELSLRYVIFGAEALSPPKLTVWMKTFPGCKMINMYGITETTVHVTYKEIRLADLDKGVSVIGKPIPTLSVHILDEHGFSVPIGVPGELYVAGLGLARGYLNLPQLTSERFMMKSLTDSTSERMYRSGDLVRWLPDGDIEYLGRLDDQVKINGYRIELGEIENVLYQSGLVKQSVILARTDLNGKKRLIGYVIPNGIFKEEIIKSYLREQLPAYMIPAVWISLDLFPLTSNGKIDKKSLPVPDREQSIQSAPLNQIEEELLSIWRELFSVENISTRDNFFQLGGDSLLLMNLSSKIYLKWGVRLSTTVLFDLNKIVEIAALIENEQDHLTPEAEYDKEVESLSATASVSERFLYIRNKFNYFARLNHAAAVLKITGIFDLKKAQQAFIKVIQFNESLRTGYFFKDGVVEKKLNSRFDFNIIRVESKYSSIDRQLNELKEPFELSAPPLIRVFYIRTTKNEEYLSIVLPHICCDGMSLEVIIQEFRDLYNGLKAKPDKLQFSYFQHNLQSYLQSPGFKIDELYWKSKLENKDRFLVFKKTGFPDLLRANAWNASSLTFKFSSLFSSRLKVFSGTHHITKFQTLIIAYFILLNEISGENNLYVMIPVHNRDSMELTKIVGMLSNTTIINININPNLAFKASLEKYRKDIITALNHQRYPFEFISADFKKIYPQSRNVNLYNAFFNYQLFQEKYDLEKADMTWYMPKSAHENIPLSLEVQDFSSSIGFRLTARSDFFDQQSLQNIKERYVKILRSMLKLS